MRQVFVSYAREDHSRAQRLAAVLEGRGLSVWWDRTILAGEKYEEEIQRALDEAGCVIVLWSKSSIASDWVVDEAEDGKRRKILVPALIDDVRIPLGFRRIQTESLIDWRGDSAHEGVQRLVSAVIYMLRRETAPDATPPATWVEPPDSSDSLEIPVADESAKDTKWLARHLQASLGDDVVVLDFVGTGRTGLVYLAEQVGLGRKIAIKALMPRLLRDRSVVAHFKRGVNAMARCAHPNIVPVYSLYHASDGLPYFTMEYVDGETLARRIADGGKLPLSEAVRIVAQLADALTFAHEQGLVHRDMNPSEILIEKGTNRPLITDFGLAGLVSTGDAAASLSGARLLSTPAYTSPEEAIDSKYSAASDQYALALIAFEMLTGKRPFPGPGAEDYLRQHAYDKPPSLRDVDPQLPASVAAVIARALQKDPAGRYPTARRFGEALVDAARPAPAVTVEKDDAEVATVEPAAPPQPRKAPEPRRPPTRPPRAKPSGGRLQPARWLLTTRVGLTALAGIVFFANLAETLGETYVTGKYGWGAVLRLNNTHAFSWLEGHLSFEFHDLTNSLAVYGYSTSYFFIFPILVLGTGIVLAGRSNIEPYRVFSLSLAIDYLISLPFFLFLPIPERWAYPDSGAMLLSDRWTSQLIETIRPISGLDNCFPSFHTSLTVIVIMLGYMYRTRLRTSVLALGLTIVFSTFVLGIHWLADIIAGTAAGVLSVQLARRADRALADRYPVTPVTT